MMIYKHFDPKGLTVWNYISKEYTSSLDMKFYLDKTTINIYCNGWIGQWRKGQQVIRIQDVDITHFNGILGVLFKHFMINRQRSFPSYVSFDRRVKFITVQTWRFFHCASIFGIGLRNRNSFQQSEVANKSSPPSCGVSSSWQLQCFGTMEHLSKLPIRCTWKL